MKDIEEVLGNVEADISHKTKITFNSIDHGLRLLERSRAIREFIDAVCLDINLNLLNMFKERKIEEYRYKNFLIKPSLVTKYNCSKLEQQLSEEAKAELMRFQKFYLTKSIIDQGIEEGIIEANSIDDFIDSGLVTKKVRKFIRFSKTKAD